MDSMSSPTELKSITPILFVTDVPTSATDFRDKLGFAIDFLHGEPPFYGAVSRDGVCIHFRCVRQPNFVELAAREHSLILASIEVADVHAFFAELQGRGADIVQPPTKQTWGGTDLYVRDPDGNVISFVTFGL